MSGYLSARNRHFGILLLQYNVLVILKRSSPLRCLLWHFLTGEHADQYRQFIAGRDRDPAGAEFGGETDHEPEQRVRYAHRGGETLQTSPINPSKPEGTLELPPGEQGIETEMKNLSFSYTDETDILKNISLRIGPGKSMHHREKTVRVNRHCCG